MIPLGNTIPSLSRARARIGWCCWLASIHPFHPIPPHLRAPEHLPPSTPRVRSTRGGYLRGSSQSLQPAHRVSVHTRWVCEGARSHCKRIGSDQSLQRCSHSPHLHVSVPPHPVYGMHAAAAVVPYHSTTCHTT